MKLYAVLSKRKAPKKRGGHDATDSLASPNAYSPLVPMYCKCIFLIE